MNIRYRPWRNAYTPFLRRFTNERARELAETKQLYNAVRARHKASKWADLKAYLTISRSILQSAGQHIDIDTHHPLFEPLLNCQFDVLQEEHVVFGFPENVEWGSLELSDFVEK